MKYVIVLKDEDIYVGTYEKYSRRDLERSLWMPDPEELFTTSNPEDAILFRNQRSAERFLDDMPTVEDDYPHGMWMVAKIRI